MAGSTMLSLARHAIFDDDVRVSGYGWVYRSAQSDNGSPVLSLAAGLRDIGLDAIVGDVRSGWISETLLYRTISRRPSSRGGRSSRCSPRRRLGPASWRWSPGADRRGRRRNLEASARARVRAAARVADVGGSDRAAHHDDELAPGSGAGLSRSRGRLSPGRFGTARRACPLPASSASRSSRRLPLRAAGAQRDRVGSGTPPSA